MKEQQIHAGFMMWLKKNQLFYIHSTFGKKATMTKDAPDFIILHCNRALLVECKTARGALTPGQQATFERLRSRSGMVVQIVRSVEEAVSAVETWLGVENSRGGHVVSVPEPSASCSSFILNFAGKDCVFTGDPTPGGEVAMIRQATPADLINIPRR